MSELPALTLNVRGLAIAQRGQTIKFSSPSTA